MTEQETRAKVRRHAFYLLGCESCGHFAPPPKRFDAPIARAASEPMRCAECGDLLLLVEGWVARESQMWQVRPGCAWHHVAFPGLLPEREGRMVWTDD